MNICQNESIDKKCLTFNKQPYITQHFGFNNRVIPMMFNNFKKNKDEHETFELLSYKVF